MPSRTMLYCAGQYLYSVQLKALAQNVLLASINTLASSLLNLDLRLLRASALQQIVAHAKALHPRRQNWCYVSQSRCRRATQPVV